MSSLKFLKKEFKEIFKTYKIWVVPLIFVFFGFMSPIVTKLLPKILEAQMKAQNIAFKIPTPTALESFSQYFKNLSQIGALAVILLSMGLVSEEKSKGTLHLILTKPVSRSSVIISKFIAQAVLVSSSVIIGAGCCYLYTIVLFTEGSLKSFSQGVTLYLVYYLLLIALTLFFSTLFSNQIAAGGLSLILFFGLTILPSLNKLMAKYSPYALTIIADNILKKGEVFFKSGWPLAISLTVTALFLFLSCAIFNHQEL
jgi:ABC-2 type transport system permease protein